MPGFGRGPPLPGALERGAPAGRLPPPGRGGMAPGPGAPGPAGAPGPPGRAPDGRGCAAWPTPKGLLPTRGERGPGLEDRGVGGGTVDGPGSPGRGPENGVGLGGVPPRSCAATGRCSAGRSAGRCSAGRCSVGRCSTGGTRGVGAAGGAGRDAAGRCGGAGAGRCGGAGGRVGPGFGPRPGSELGGAPPLPERPPPEPPLPDGNESRSLRATGASTVEDADFTNSPRSLSLVSTSLLVTPSSFASSCTRALPATALLTVGAGGNPARPRC